MKTWTVDKDGYHIVVSADNVEQAIQQIQIEHPKIALTNADLVPLPTHHRHVRVLKTRIDSGIKAGSFSHIFYDDICEPERIFIYFENCGIQSLGPYDRLEAIDLDECCIHLSADQFEKMKQYFIDHPTKESI